MAKMFPYLRTALQENKTSVITEQKKKKKKNCARHMRDFTLRAPGLNPDYFCHDIVFLIFKDLEHSAERHKLD